jgi:hypothetical protein
MSEVETESVARHPSVAEKMAFFECNHLPEPLFSVANLIRTAALEIEATVEDHPQLAIGLQHLIEAKDCFVRAAVAQENKRKGNTNLGSPLLRVEEVV